MQQNTVCIWYERCNACMHAHWSYTGHSGSCSARTTQCRNSSSDEAIAYTKHSSSMTSIQLALLSPHYSTCPTCITCPSLQSLDHHHYTPLLTTIDTIHYYRITMAKLPTLSNEVVQYSLQYHSEVHIRSAVDEVGCLHYFTHAYY
jgi:hypothetical protein